jgi:hypothetical protein
MSTSQFAVGFVAVLGLGQIALTSVLPDPHPITVHSLTYVSGEIVQDRTVVAEGEFFPAQWRAYIVDAATDKPIPECAGEGFWPYKTGRAAFTIPLDKWTGNTACTVDFLRSYGGEFYPVASWHWGNDFEKATGATFVVE